MVGGALSLLVPVSTAAAGAAPARGEACRATQVRYRVAGKLKLGDTPLNAGNGDYRVGPGALRLRFDHAGTQRVELLEYRLHMDYSYTTSLIGMRTTVAVRATARATPDRSGVVARGRIQSGALVWSTPVSGYRTDGTVTCSGAMCGKFGMPPAGETRFSDGPAPVEFKPFRFRLGDLRRFTMESTEVSRLELPKATVAVALVGREVGRRCVP